MSDEQSAATATSAPATQTAAPAQAPPAAPAADKPRVKADDLPPDALKARLLSEADKARREVLAALGVESVDAAKATLEAGQKALDAQKTEIERLREQAAALEAKTKQADEYSAIIRARAVGEMASLTEAQAAAVKGLAGDDPAKQLSVLDAMRPTWGATSLQSEAEAQAAAQPPATTAPARGAPAEQQLSPTDHQAVYRELQKTNPFAATQYLQRHLTDVFPNQ